MVASQGMQQPQLAHYMANKEDTPWARIFALSGCGGHKTHARTRSHTHTPKQVLLNPSVPRPFRVINFLEKIFGKQQQQQKVTLAPGHNWHYPGTCFVLSLAVGAIWVMHAVNLASVASLWFKSSLIKLRPQAKMPLTAEAVKIFLRWTFVPDNAQGKQSSMGHVEHA